MSKAEVVVALARELGMVKRERLIASRIALCVAFGEGFED